MSAVFVDYDGTITDLDTFDVLVRRAAGVEVWAALERQLAGGRLTLRETLQRQARHIRVSVDEADRMLLADVRFDPTFVPFVERCQRAGHSLAVVSSGVAPLIRRALARNGLSHVELVANEVDADEAGWRLRFEGESDNGTDKVALVRAASARGVRTVYIGDGWSDIEAAEASDVRYVKRGRTLERYLAKTGLSFTLFDHFAEIDPARF